MQLISESLTGVLIMAKLQLANSKDMVFELSFAEVGINAIDPSGYGTSNVNLTKSYDTDTGKVTFEYPKLIAGNEDTVEAETRIHNTLSDQRFKRNLSNIAVSTTSGHLTIEMPAKVFEHLFDTKTEVKLDQPVNLLAEFAPEVKGSGNLTDNVVSLDKNRVSLYYGDIHTTTGSERASEAILEKIPERHRDKLEFRSAGASFVVSMPVSTYEELSGQKLPVGRKVG
jgi:hypothetical protein